LELYGLEEELEKSDSKKVTSTTREEGEGEEGKH
jgi:hypothetical protein